MIPLLTRESPTRSVASLYECSNNHNNHDVVGSSSYDEAYPSRKRMRRRRVTFSEADNTSIPVLSLNDYSPTELSSTYYSREEYAHMRDCVKYTVRFLKYRKYPPPAFASILNLSNENDDICVRGLECLADDYVNMHRKRARELSMAAVFAYQNMSHIQNPFSMNGSYTATDDAEAMAQAYMIHTQRSQNIAGRWGHFDALDAGIKDKTPEIIAIDF